MAKIYPIDLLNFLSKQTPRRVVNALKVVASYYATRWLQKPQVWGKPFTVSFEPTTACNLRCPECPSGLREFTRPTGNLKADFFIRTMDEIADRLLYLIFYFQGEPYINPNFLDMVKHASERGVYTITSTNGHFLNDKNAKRTIESGLDRLIISVDGTTQEVYEQYRKEGKLESVLQGARNLVKWKKELNSTTPHLIFQFLVVKPNEHQMDDVVILADEIGIDEVKFKTAQLYDQRKVRSLLQKRGRYLRAEKQNAEPLLETLALLCHHLGRPRRALLLRQGCDPPPRRREDPEPKRSLGRRRLRRLPGQATQGPLRN
jgi:pyruvate-formate lyase-activating enzyme